MGKNIKYRHELKYPCSDGQIAIIQSRLQNLMCPDCHAENGCYSIRSLYFDNYESRCFHENENGTDPREKYRIRIYNASDARISLECKRKERGKTYKTSCLLTREQCLQLIEGGQGLDLTAAPELLRKFWILMHTQYFRPAVIVEYDRIPYVYEIGNVRITLDRNIRSSSDFSSFFEKNLAARPILPSGQHLLEVKYDEFLPEFIMDRLELGDLQQTSFSKFYLCRKFITGGTI